MFRWVVHLHGDQRRHGDAAVAVGHMLYSFGGFNIAFDNTIIDVDVFNTVSLCWKKLPPDTTGKGQSPLQVPTRRSGHTAVLIEDVVYMFGGLKYTNWTRADVCDELYTFDVNTHRWFKPKASGTAPDKMQGHSACVLNKVMYTDYHNTIYKLDTTTMVWSLINPSSYPSVTIIGTKTVAFGCHLGKERNIRVFDTENNCWLSIPSAQLHSEEGHSTFAYNGELYLFGGTISIAWSSVFDSCYNNLWKFNPETFSWKKVEPKGKGPCPTFQMSCCVVGDRIILFGGYMGDTSTDLYILDTSPSLKTLCNIAVIQFGLEQSELPRDIRWELAAMRNETCN